MRSKGTPAQKQKEADKSAVYAVEAEVTFPTGGGIVVSRSEVELSSCGEVIWSSLGLESLEIQDLGRRDPIPVLWFAVPEKETNTQISNFTVAGDLHEINKNCATEGVGACGIHSLVVKLGEVPTFEAGETEVLNEIQIKSKVRVDDKKAEVLNKDRIMSMGLAVGGWSGMTNSVYSQGH